MKNLPGILIVKDLEKLKMLPDEIRKKLFQIKFTDSIQKMIEKTILENLTQNEEYSRRVLPFLQNEYFTDDTEKYLFSKISGFISKYNTLPDKNTLTLEIDEDTINEGLHKTSTEYVKNFGEINENIDWLIDTTEKFCQEKAVYNAIMQSIKIIDGKDKKKEMELPGSALQQLALWQLVIGYRLRETEATGEWKKMLD